MSEPVRVAVQLGTDAVRVAAAADEGDPWLVAELPPATHPAGDVPEQIAALFADLVGPPGSGGSGVDELVLVHPAALPASSATAWTAGCAGLAATVRAVPAPLAAAAGAPEGLRAGRPGLIVLDVGSSGAEATRLGGDGRVLGVRRSDVGGRRLDELVAARFAPGGGAEAGTEARRVREALSLLAAVEARGGLVSAAQVRPVLAGALGAVVERVAGLLTTAGAVPVLLIGGVARTPLLAELLDEAEIADVTVAARPDAAAVLGALRLPRDSGVTAPACSGAGAPSQASERSEEPEEPCWLGEPPRRRFRALRVAVTTAVAAALVVALLAVGRSVASTEGTEPIPAAGVLVQYGYRFEMPDGWEHTGGLPERRRVLLTPVAAPEGSDLIAVEHSPLGYDSAAEPERAQAELRSEFAAAVAAGSRLSGYDAGARVAGRAGTAYRQEETGGTVVEWFVVLDGDAQLSVGCRHTRANAESVRAACARVVASVGRA